MTISSACEYSLQVGEALIGSAPRSETWLLLEYPRPWGAKAYAESSIPDGVKAYLDAQLAVMPNGRLQMIGRGNRVELTDLALYVIDARWAAQRIRRFMLPTYEALLELPLAAIAAGDAEMGEAATAPLYIVCTNGKRDLCCARHGLPVYNALRAAGAEAWQCDHIGGHRFAGTLVAFPHGIYYGRVDEAGAAQIAEAHTAGEMALPYLRGRACAEPHVQVAELFTRLDAGITTLDALGEPSVAAMDGGWRVRFPIDSAEHEVVVASEPTPFDVIANSGEASGKPGVQYRRG
jgi:hypothetical protein